MQEDEAKRKENIGGEIQTGKSQKVPRNKNKRRKKIVFGKIQDGGLEIRPLVGGWREVEDLQDLLDLLQERWWKRGKTEEEWMIGMSGRRCWIQYHKSGGDTVYPNQPPQAMTRKPLKTSVKNFKTLAERF